MSYVFFVSAICFFILLQSWTLGVVKVWSFVRGSFLLQSWTLQRQNIIQLCITTTPLIVRSRCKWISFVQSLPYSPSSFVQSPPVLAIPVFCRKLSKRGLFALLLLLRLGSNLVFVSKAKPVLLKITQICLFNFCFVSDCGLANSWIGRVGVYIETASI